MYRNVRIIEPYSHRYGFRVKPNEAGKTLLDFLFERFPYRLKAVWRERIEQGYILVNESSTEPDQTLSANQIISHYNPNVIEPSVPDEISIIEESVSWIAFYKPAPMPVHAGGRYFKQTLISIAEAMCSCRLFITHRLDAVTSGIVLLGKSKESATQITANFKNRNVIKEYRAVVSGQPKKQSWSVESPLKRKKGFVFETSELGKPALTHFRVIKQFEHYALVSCQPLTGRTHQIRVHLLESNVPITDDGIYNPSVEGDRQVQRRGIALCHFKLQIPSLEIDLTSPKPKEWPCKMF